MKTKILISLIVLICLFVGGVFVWKNISVPEEKVEVAEVIYKGIWLPGINPNYLASHIQEMKDMGMNTVSLALMFYEEDNKVIGMDVSHILDDIRVAHENGMKVMLNPQFHPQPKLEDLDVEELNSKIVEVAKLAEEYDVELFAPMNEPENILSKNTGKWRQEILPRIKEVYHGEVVWKGAMLGPRKTLSEEFLEELSEGPPGDFSGYDYIGFTLLSEGQTLEEYSQYVDNALKYVLALAERDNCKGVMISEFGVVEGGPWSGSEEEIARAYEIVLEKGKEKVVGFFALDFLEVELPGIPLKKEALKTEEVIKRWFREIL